MIKIKRKIDSFEVTHPNDPDVVISLERLRRLDAVEYSFELGPDPKFSPENVAKLFQKTVKNIKGLVDEDTGEPIEWNGDVSLIFDPVLNITKEDGTSMAFWIFILEKVNLLVIKGEDPNTKS